MADGTVKTNMRFSKRLWRGVTLQLFLVAVLPLIVLVLAVTFGSLTLHHQAMRSLVADRNLRAVESAATSIGKEIYHRAKTLEILVKGIENNGQVKSTLEKYQAELSIFDGGSVALDENGQVIDATGNPSLQEFLSQPSWPKMFALIKTSPANIAGYLPVQNISGQQFEPIYATNSAGITLLGLVSPNIILADSLGTVWAQEPVTIIAVDQSGQILYQTGKLAGSENIASHPGIQDALAGKSEINYLDTSQGEHVITTSAIQPVGWALMVEESWEDIASPLLQATQYAPLIIIPILALSFVALWFGLKQIVQPMQALEKKAADLASGNYLSIKESVGGVPEISRLQLALMDMASKVQDAQTSLHSYIGAITDSVETERRSLARELHDDTLQSLIAMGQYTQYAIYWNRDPKVQQTLDQITSQNDQAIKNLRQLVQGLRPIYIEDLGLTTALSMLANRKENQDSLQVHFQVEGDERRLTPEIEMALYRITQEALSNIHRHSQARNSWIALEFNPRQVNLEIRDDGIGFTPPPDPTHYARKGHYGLLGLFERAELIGAHLTIQSDPGDGTLIRVQLNDKQDH